MSAPADEQFNALVDAVANQVSGNGKSHQYLKAIGLLILVAYAYQAAPKLPLSVRNFLQNPLIQIIFFFLLAYTFGMSASASIVAALVFLLLILVINAMSNEGFEGTNGSVASMPAPIATGMVGGTGPTMPKMGSMGMGPMAKSTAPMVTMQPGMMGSIQDEINDNALVNLGNLNCPPIMETDLAQYADRPFPYDDHKGRGSVDAYEGVQQYAMV